jgi:hypothetical protein
MNLWEKDTLNQEQQSEIDKILSLKSGRDLLLWYQSRLRHGYYVNKHRIFHVKSQKEVMKELESPSDLMKYVEKLQSTILIYRMEDHMQYYMENTMYLPKEYNQPTEGAYITTGLFDPSKARSCAKSGNPLVAYGDKYLALSDCSASITLYGKELDELYSKGVHKTYGTEHVVGNETTHNLYQVVTMIPTKLFLEMTF